MTGEMDLSHLAQREVCKIICGGVALVRRGYEDVVDVEQQSAPAAPGQRAKKVSLRHRGFAEGDICRRVFQQDRSADGVLDLVDVVLDARQGRLSVRQRQEVIEVGGLVRRPGE